jgi:alpha-galactosidase
MKSNEYIASVNIGDSYYKLKKGETVISNLKFTINLENQAEGLYAWTVYLENLSIEKSPRIRNFLGLDTTINVKGKTILNTLDGDTCSIESFAPRSFNLNNGTILEREPCGARPSNYTAFPYFDLKDESEYGLVFGIGWTGQWKLNAERQGDEVRITSGFSDCDFILNPGEKIRSVKILLYYGKGDTITLRHKFVKYHREFYSPFPNFDESFFPISAVCFDRYYWGIEPKDNEVIYLESEDAQLKVIESAAKCKYINAFWLDACWFEGAFRNGVGNYAYARGFSSGLSKLSDTAHKNGMKFILWFEPVRCEVGSEIYNRFYKDKNKIISVEGQSKIFVNLGDEEVWQYQFDRICKIIEENNVDIYRQDFNISPLVFLRSIETLDRQGIEQIRFVESLYRLWDELKKRFPNIIIDNCASGGRLLDVETLSRSIPLHRSDMACRPSPLAMQNEILALSRYIPYHQGSTFDYSPYFTRSSMTTGIACQFPYLEGIIDKETEETSMRSICYKSHLTSETTYKTIDPDKAKAQFEELLQIKKYWKGDFTPLTEPSFDLQSIVAYNLNLPNEDKGLVIVLRRENAKDTFTFKLLCVDSTANYLLKLVDEDLIKEEKTVSGKELSLGYTVNFNKAPASLLIEYSRIK